MIFCGYICAFAYALLSIFAGVVAGKLGLPKPYTRKIVHVAVGFEWVILYHFMGVSVHFLIVCLLCLVFLYVAYRFGLFSSTMGSDGDNAPGTVYYAVSMSVMAAVCLFAPEAILPFGVAVACTSFGDGAAGIVGQAVRRFNPRIFGKKTLFGALSAALVCMLSVLGFSHVCSMGLTWYECLLIGFLSAEAELLSVKGLDNIAVPLVSFAMTYAFMFLPAVYLYLVPILMTPAILLFAIEKRALTKSGIVAACCIDLLLTASLGNGGFTVLLLFFALGVLTDKIKHREKATLLGGREEKGDCRDAWQVLANAGFPTVTAALFFATGQSVFLVMFIACMAEALGDTSASGIGVLSRRAFDLFRMRPCERGMSGGMSPLGTGTAAFACVFLSAVGIWLFALPWTWLWLCVLGAFLGTLTDSMLGSLLQVKYRCAVCGKLTERRKHCDTPTEHVGGLVFLNNDAVNAISSFMTACITAILFLLCML